MIAGLAEKRLQLLAERDVELFLPRTNAPTRADVGVVPAPR